MCIMSDGSYGVAEGIYFSMPVTCRDRSYEIVQGLELDAFDRTRLKATEQELLGERSAIEDLIPKR
jgi:malate dehydrogenase